jgi:hypothetical protein
MDTFSEDYLEKNARILVCIMDRNNIFPPLLNDAKRIILQNKLPLHQRKRTPNEFFICRMNVQKEVKRNGLKISMRIVSKAASLIWNSASSEEKYQYILIANKVKELKRKSMQENENSYNPYYSFQLSSHSNTIITTQENTEITFFQNFYYSYNFLILPFYL